MTTTKTLAALMLGFALMGPTAALAQVQQDGSGVPRDLFTEQLRQQGNSVTFCYNPDGMMAEFEKELADAIASVLLVEPDLFALERSVLPQPPLDHRLPYQNAQMFVALAQDCDALMGFSLSPSNPDFILVTAPYMVTPTDLVTIDPAANRLEDFPEGSVIATRGLSLADNALINFLKPQGDRWVRTSYRNNQDVLEAALGGTVAAAFVWEPALYVATGGEPALYGLRVIEDPPFTIRPLETGIATRSDNTYLNQLLTDAIAALQADGTVTALMEKHLLKPPVTAP